MPAMLRDGGLLAIFPTPPAAPLFATADFALRALGDMVAGTLQGIWKRNGKIVTMRTLGQFSNGDMIYARGKVDLVQGTMSFTAYPIP